MTTSKTVTSRDLASKSSLQYIRAQTLSISLIEARPNTKMYVFFDEIDVTHLCGPSTGNVGDALLTDANGQLEIKFFIPAGTYNTGNKNIIVTDTRVLANLDTLGSVYGSATAVFATSGTLETYKNTSTTTVTTRRTVQTSDPLAQSFFTHGIAGGMFVSSVDVYFNTKDDVLPVRMEIRPMVNGYPASIEPRNAELVSVVPAASVNISNNATLATKFTFNPPVYLEEDGDFCFVLRSNSNNYNVFTSRMGEDSIEDGRKIYAQPFVGSMFKSENAITWSAEQFEDIKFTIFKAQFDTTTEHNCVFDIDVPMTGATGESFSTVSGSNIVTYSHTQEHGLEVGSKIYVSAHASGTYNGIPGTELTANHTVTNVIDRYKVQFQVTTNATASGNIDTSDIVHTLIVSEGGINYSASDTITIGGNATGTILVENGVIKSATITSVGSGYLTNPTVTINSATGSGAAILAITDANFGVVANKPMTGFKSNINLYNHGSSQAAGHINTTIGNYEGGALTSYTGGSSMGFTPNSNNVNMMQQSLIASSYNETAIMSGASSAQMVISMSTDNANVSPVIDMSTGPKFIAYYNRINDMPDDTITSSVSSGSVSNISVTAAGSGYTVAPTVTISAPDVAGGVQATASATIMGSTLNTVVMIEQGSGYIKQPLVVITRGAGDTTGAGGAAQATLSPFNSELLPTGGNAKARYITNKNTLDIISTGARVFATISSMSGSSVDWYIRTSLSASGIEHETLEWKRLPCNTPRNRSSSISEFFEYEFRLDNVEPFDTYDLKCVLTADMPIKTPIVNSYRLIVIA